MKKRLMMTATLAVLVGLLALAFAGVAGAQSETVDFAKGGGKATVPQDKAALNLRAASRP